MKSCFRLDILIFSSGLEFTRRYFFSLIEIGVGYACSCQYHLITDLSTRITWSNDFSPTRYTGHEKTCILYYISCLDVIYSESLRLPINPTVWMTIVKALKNIYVWIIANIFCDVFWSSWGDEVLFVNV